MIVPSDRDYKYTKRIKLGKSSIKKEFRELAAWIDQTFQVHTMNIIYYTIDKGKRYGLNICVESASERRKIHGIRFYNADSKKQQAIADKFHETLLGTKYESSYQSENIWVVCSAFEPIAKDEAVENIPKEKIEELKESIHCPDIWKIDTFYSSVTFFLFTDEQLKKHEKMNMKKEWSNRFFDILEPYNEFGYFKRSKFLIYLDSKENFDNNYESNWHYYYH